jgi:hypothetical protein
MAAQANAADITTFLSKANPNGPRATLVDMMKNHLPTTATEVVARRTHDWEGDVRAYGAVLRSHPDDVGCADGIVKQFPDKFRGS